MLQTETSELMFEVLFRRGVSSSRAQRFLEELNLPREFVESSLFGGHTRLAATLPVSGAEYWRMDMENIPSVLRVRKQTI